MTSQNLVTQNTNKQCNVTRRRRGSKRKRTFFCRYVAPPGECYYNMYYVAIIIFHSQVWYRALSLRHACIPSSDIILML